MEKQTGDKKKDISQTNSENIESDHDSSLNDRFELAVCAFLEGDDSLLNENEFSERLPHFMIKEHNDGEFKSVESLLQQLAISALSDTVAIREKSLMVLAVLNSRSISSGDLEVSRKIFPILLKWLEQETIYVVGFSLICQQLQRIAFEMLHHDEREETENLLALVEQIQNGSLAKNDIIKSMVGGIRTYITSQDIYKAGITNNISEIESIPAAKSKINEGQPNTSKLLQVVREFAAGNDSLLHNEDFQKNFPHYILEQYKEGERDETLGLLQRLAECSQSKTVAKREKSLMILAVVNNLSLSSNNIQMMRDLLALQVDWLGYEAVYVVGFAVICQQIQRIALELLRNNFWDDVEPLLEVIYQIESGKLERNDIIVKMTGNIREYIGSQDVLERIVAWHESRTGGKPNYVADMVKYFGRTAVLFLLEHLILKEDKDDCLKIMKLLPGSGDVVPVLVDCLKNDPPWHVIKNVVSLVTEIKDPKLFHLVEPYLEHNDLRVQQQVLLCITSMGGPEMLKRLKAALNIVDDELKSKIVTQLGQYEGEDLADILLDLLFKKKDITTPQSLRLQLSICVVLRSFPFAGVVSLLKHYAKLRKDKRGENDKILWTVDHTLKILEPKIRHLRCSEEEEISGVSYDFSPEGEQGAKKITQALFSKAEKLVLSGKREQAGEFLFKKIVDAAREKDFKTAELLSEKLLKFDPNALPKIIRAGEIIEEEKSTSITRHHLEIWSKLYEDMTTEEFNAFYFSMRSERFDTDEIIVQSGETDQSLYFINSGTVRMVCHCDNQETFLKRIKPGEVAGVGQFFSASVWTVTLIATSFVRLQVLDNHKFSSLIREFPEIESKLRDFCVLYDTVPELVRMSGNDRREFPRYEVNVKVSSMLLDPYGNKGKRIFNGEMIDISCGGLSFYIRLSKKGNIAKLLGRQIISEIKIGKDEVLKCYGVIVRAKANDILGGDVSVHVKNFRRIDHSKVLQVAAMQG